MHRIRPFTEPLAAVDGWCKAKHRVVQASKPHPKSERSIIMANNDNITYEITRHCGVIAEEKNEWRRELNLVAWNGNPPKFDIRSWSPDHSRMTRGITLSYEEAAKVSELLAATL